MRLEGADPKAAWSGMDRMEGRANYFIGKDPAKWRTNVPMYGKVTAKNVYPGIDMVYYGNQRHLEYDFVVAPGADPKLIHMAYEGPQGARVDGEGNLVMGGRDGKILFRAPLIYQKTADGKRRILGRYVLRDGRNIGFEVASYDAKRPLVIDPVLDYSTYLGGSGDDEAYAIAVDSGGNAYVTGKTASTNFPTTSGVFQPAYGGSPQDAFVAKINPTGTGLVYATYLGGTTGDQGNGIAVDSSGNVYLTGFTAGGGFPTTSGAYQTVYGGGTHNVFVTKLASTGASLLFSTYLGGNGNDVGRGIAADSSGNVYLSGDTTSTNFPTVGAYQTALAGVTNVFVTKMASTGASLLYSTYLGGNGSELGPGLALDSSNNIYVVGNTSSTNFPTTSGALQTTLKGTTNGFVSKINPASTGTASLVYSTYLGGTGSDKANKVAVDSSGNAYVVGSTTSTNFPTTAGAYQTTYSGTNKAFIAKLAALGNSLVYSTYLGGSGADFGNRIAINGNGYAYIAGYTNSTNFPTTSGAYQTTLVSGATDNVFVTALNPAGNGLLYSSYLGGGTDDQGDGVAVDTAGSVYVTGLTGSTNFPTTLGAYQTANAGTTDIFVAKFDVSDFYTMTPTSTPTNTPTPTPTNTGCYLDVTTSFTLSNQTVSY
ncbi:MAG TPA: SBBP repeat-containing protein, partial [bacterium]|nr:SBBP repeat-containing protein [bacterium]